MKKDNIFVTKASGEKEQFKLSRLRRSLKHSGASDKIVNQVINEIAGQLHNGITTKEIYEKAFAFLRKASGSVAARYKLKKAIFELGPTGFPFEKFVAEILRYEGFDVKVDVMVRGHCVKHEVDVVAEKKDKHFMVECKFHSNQGRFCDVKVPLYIQSRFKDVEKQWRKRPGHHTKFHQGWIFTNTRFTTDAIQFGKCSGLMLIGWDFPAKDSLKDRIERAGLHPVTCLTTLSKIDKKKLLENDIVLCMDLCHQPHLLESIGVKKSRFRKILLEAHDLCNM